MPSLKPLVGTESFARRTIASVWSTASGGDAIYAAYLKENRGVHYKIRAAFRKARRKGVHLNLGSLGMFADALALEFAIGRLLDGSLQHVTKHLLQLERELDLALCAMLMLPNRPKMAKAF